MSWHWKLIAVIIGVLAVAGLRIGLAVGLGSGAPVGIGTSSAAAASSGTARMDRHEAMRRLRPLAATIGIHGARHTRTCSATGTATLPAGQPARPGPLDFTKRD